MNGPPDSRDERPPSAGDDPVERDGAVRALAGPDGAPDDGGRAHPQVDDAGAAGGRPVDPRTVAVWRWVALIGAVPVAAAGAVFTISMLVAGGPVGDVLWIAYPLLLAALGLNAWWYPAARYRRLRYRLDPTGITIMDGILWRTESSVARVRIQHTDISQGPLQRRYGVATLKLYTAGSRFTKIELPGLEYGDAVRLRDRLLEDAEGDAV
ncbi:MAG TPA: PH domain-containing protein [Gammaproteobacteria bacterium]